MNVVVVTPPGPLVSLEEAKLHLRVDADDDDDVIEALIAAASAHMDGPEGWLGRAIGQQQVVANAWCFAGHNFALPLLPVISVQSLNYLDSDNVEQAVDQNDYKVSGGRIWLRNGYSLPSLYSTHDAVRVAYTAGYAEIPAPLKVAALLHVGTLYQNRESVGEAQDVLPHAYEALCAPYRVWRV